MSEIRNSGYIKDKIVKGDYVFGGGFLGDKKKIIKPDGQWTPAPFEPQNKGKFETYNCTTFHTLNPIEILIKTQYGIEENYSDRLLGIYSGTSADKGGNSPHTVAMALHGEGIAREEILPFSEDLEDVKEYYSFKNGDPVECAKEAFKWLEKYEFFHEWVFEENDSLLTKQKKLMDSLKYSPLGVSVKAWKSDGGFYFKEESENDNHWTTLVGYKKDEYWIVADSYIPELKKLRWDYNFGMAKVYFVFKKNAVQGEEKKNWLQDLIESIINLIKLCFKQLKG